nr:MAG TPA: hypothetical protein [Caudoviricetes sp.]
MLDDNLASATNSIVFKNIFSLSYFSIQWY